MITNFEEITEDITEAEKSLVPFFVKGFATKTKENPIKAPEIVKLLNEFLKKQGIDAPKITPERLRKIVNYIRVNSLLPLIATSKGYYVSEDQDEIIKQIQSLKERAAAIVGAANGLMKFVK